MSYLRRRLFRRFGLLGRVADLAMVGTAGLRLAHRRGWIGDDQIEKLGVSSLTAQNSASAGTMPLGESLIAGAAAWRLLRGRYGKKRRRRRC